MKKYLEVRFRDGVYRVDLNYIKGLHAAKLGMIRDDCVEITELFFKDDKYVVSWVSMNMSWDDIKERALKVSETLPDYAAEWDGAEKMVVNC